MGDDTKEKAQARLKLLQDTKDAWIGYAENSETIAADFEYTEEEIKKVKKKFNLEAALEDMKKRQDLYNGAKSKIDGLFASINANFACMSITLPEDKKKIVDKEIKAVSEKLEVTGRFGAAVAQIEEFVARLTTFDSSLKAINAWMAKATAELEDIKNAAGSMLPEDRVARTMDLQEDIAAKFVTDLDAKTRKECDAYSEDVKYWAEYRTGIKEFTPWLTESEAAVTGGLSKPSDLDEVKALSDQVTTFDKKCLTSLKVLESAEEASKKMTTHAEADTEVAALKARYNKVKGVSEGWVKKVDTLLKEWVLLDNTVTELNSWVAKDKTAEGENQFSLEKMESTLGELKNIFKTK